MCYKKCVVKTFAVLHVNEKPEITEELSSYFFFLLQVYCTKGD